MNKNRPTHSMHEVGRVGLDLSCANRDRAYRSYVCRHVPGLGWTIAHVLDMRPVRSGLADLGACAKAIDALWGE